MELAVAAALAGMVVAAAGAAINGIGWVSNQFAARREYKSYKNQLLTQGIMELAALDDQFAVNQKEAFKSADRSDAQTTKSEKLTSDEFNNQLDFQIIGEEDMSASWNSQLMQAGSESGGAFAQLAMSGTRDSSQASAIEMQQETFEDNFQRQQDTQRAQADYAFNSLLNGMQTNIFNMQNQRNDAKDLRASWQDGGDQFRLYQDQRNKTMLQYYYSVKQVNNAIDDTLFTWKNAGKNTLSMLQAASGGAQTGMNVYDKVSSFFSNAKNFSGGK